MWKTTCLERPQNSVVALYRFHYTTIIVFHVVLYGNCLQKFNMLWKRLKKSQVKIHNRCRWHLLVLSNYIALMMMLLKALFVTYVNKRHSISRINQLEVTFWATVTYQRYWKMHIHLLWWNRNFSLSVSALNINSWLRTLQDGLPAVCALTRFSWKWIK